MKILVIGLDCAAPELLLDEERLENLRRLMDAGCYGRLESIIPPITVPAWMCMATSQDPGSLGRLRLPQPRRSFVRRPGDRQLPLDRRAGDLGPGRTRGEALDHRRRPPRLSPPQGQRHLGRLLPDPGHRAERLHAPGRARTRDRAARRLVSGRRQGLPHPRQGLAQGRDLRHEPQALRGRAAPPPERRSGTTSSSSRSASTASSTASGSTTTPSTSCTSPTARSRT